MANPAVTGPRDVGEYVIVRLVVAQDMPTRPRLKTNGGHGYQYLIETFLSMLREEGVSEEASRQ